MGLNLYFRFLKSTAKYFFLFSVITLPILVVALLSGSANPSEISLASLTLGSVIEYNSACGFYTQDNTLSASKQVIDMDCQNGILDVSKFRVGFLGAKQESLTSCRRVFGPEVVSSCNIQGNSSALETMLNSTCHDKARCTIVLTDAKMLEYFSNTGDCA